MGLFPIGRHCLASFAGEFCQEHPEHQRPETEDELWRYGQPGDRKLSFFKSIYTLSAVFPGANAGVGGWVIPEHHTRPQFEMGVDGLFRYRARPGPVE